MLIRRDEWQFAHGEYASMPSYAHGESCHLMQSSPRANGMMKDGAIITKGEWQFARTRHAAGIRKGESLFAPDRSSIKCWEMGRMMNNGVEISKEIEPLIEE